MRASHASIDIGLHAVRVAQVHEGRSGVRAIRFAEEALPAGFRWEVGGDRRPLVGAIRLALASAGIRRRSAVMALPRRQVTARIGSYPEAGRAVMRRVIEYDLSDQIPFPVEQVVLDFQPLGRSREQPGLTDVLVVAAQRDLVREYLGLARDLGMNLAALTVDALALQDVVELACGGEPGVTLVVETGARASTINVSEGRRLVLTRSVGLGGQQLTLAIRDDLGLALEEAEELKRREGFALLDQGPGLHRISAWLDNFRGELRRSALTTGHAVAARVCLTGQGSQVPGLTKAVAAEFETDPVRLSVAQLFPQATLLGPDAETADRCLLAIAQALRDTSHSTWSISLVPRELARIRRVRRLRASAAVAGMLAVGLMAFGYVSGLRSLRAQRAEVKILQGEARTAEKQRKQAQKLLDERDQAKRELEVLQPAQAARFHSLELLRTLSEAAPSGIVLSSFVLRPGQPLRIQGSAASTDAVADIQAALSRSPLVTSVTLDRIDQALAPALARQQAPSATASQRRGGARQAAPAPPPPAMERPQESVTFAMTVHLWNERQTAISTTAPLGVLP